MFNPYLSAGFWLAFTIILALLEIEIEGRHGWAEKLPVWHYNGRLKVVWLRLMNHKPLTSYHLYLFLLVFLVFHAPYAQGITWSWQSEAFTFSLFLTVAAFWDYFWFILNPHFGFRRFKQNYIWWHQQSLWLLGLPVDYYGAISLSLLFTYWANNWPGYLLYLFIFLGGTLVVIALSPLYHRFYWSKHVYTANKKPNNSAR